MKIRKIYISPKIEVYKMDSEVNSAYASEGGPGAPNKDGDFNWGAMKSAAPRSKSSSFSSKSVNDDNSFVGKSLTGGGDSPF